MDIKKGFLISSEGIAQISKDSRCFIGKNVTVEEGTSIYLDPKAKGLRIEDGCHISRGAHIEVNGGATIQIGRNVTIGRDTTIAAMSLIIIGDGVGIANGVSVRDHNHRPNNSENIQTGEKVPWASGFETAPIHIEDMAIVSDGVRILPGVRIGQNSFVGAGVHLRRSIAPNLQIVGDAHTIKILDKLTAPLTETSVRGLTFDFFGDSLIDRPAIVTTDPHFDLPKIGEDVKVTAHQTAGFYRMVLHRLQCAFPENTFDFNNLAKGGSTIRDVCAQIRSAPAGFNDVSFICVGINDIWRRFQGRDSESVHLDEFAQLYDESVKLLLKRSRLVFCIGEPLVSIGENSTKFNAELMKYNEAIKEVATRHAKSDVYFIDLFGPFERVNSIMKAYNPGESLWIDGIHLSQLGNTLASDTILRFLDTERIEARLLRLHRYERAEAARRYGTD